MRLILQRVSRAEVRVDCETIAAIGQGFLVLAGFGAADGEAWAELPATPAWRKVCEKLVGLRVFADAEGKLNLSVGEVGGEVLVVSQFTLHADCRRGRRPSFHTCAPPEAAEPLYERLLADLDALLPGRVQGGRFGAMMAVELVNDGPVTIILDSADFS